MHYLGLINYIRYWSSHDYNTKLKMALSIVQQGVSYQERELGCKLAFPQLKSQTYSDLIEELAAIVRPLQNNFDLQRKFVSIVKTSRKDLLAFSNELNNKKDSSELLRVIIIATAAFRELPNSAVDFILKMSCEEKRNVFLLFQQIPLSSSSHAFLYPAPSESDTLCQNLLSNIGFSNYRGHLIYERKKSWSCDQLDMISLAIIAIHSVSTIH